MTAKIGYDHIFLREENLSFDMNYFNYFNFNNKYI